MEDSFLEEENCVLKKELARCKKAANHQTPKYRVIALIRIVIAILYLRNCVNIGH